MMDIFFANFIGCLIVFVPLIIAIEQVLLISISFRRLGMQPSFSEFYFCIEDKICMNSYFPYEMEKFQELYLKYLQSFCLSSTKKKPLPIHPPS